jgi:hypothetical protein
MENEKSRFQLWKTRFGPGKPKEHVQHRHTVYDVFSPVTAVLARCAGFFYNITVIIQPDRVPGKERSGRGSACAAPRRDEE